MQHYPHFIGAAGVMPQGIIKGEDDSSVTTKKIWKDAEVRAIEDVRANRIQAYSIDALTQLITRVQIYSILGSSEVHTADDETHAKLISEIENWITDIKLLKSFRRWFPDLIKHGCVYVQKQKKDIVRTVGEPKELTSLQQLEGVIKKPNPFDATDYYLYQKLKIDADWKNPDSTTEVDKKVWYIKDGRDGISNYTAIKPMAIDADPTKASGDVVVDLASIIEIENNESGDIPIIACMNEIYIKNLIMLNMPNLIYLIISPMVKLVQKTFIESKDGTIIWKAPQYPDSRLETSNKAEFDRLVTEYTTWQANIQDAINKMWDNYLKKGIMSFSEIMDVNVMESNKAMNPAMLETIVKILNTEIAFSLGFPLSLLDASGSELATSRNILTTMSGVLRGIQTQYEAISLDLIYEQFPEAQKAGITFILSELNPKDAKDLAEVEKLHADILKIYKDVGASDHDLQALSRKYNLLDDPELSGEGLATGVSEAYPKNDMKAALEMIHRITEDRKTVAIEL